MNTNRKEAQAQFFTGLQYSVEKIRELNKKLDATNALLSIEVNLAVASAKPLFTQLLEVEATALKQLEELAKEFGLPLIQEYDPVEGEVDAEGEPLNRRDLMLRFIASLSPVGVEALSGVIEAAIEHYAYYDEEARELLSMMEDRLAFYRDGKQIYGTGWRPVSYQGQVVGFLPLPVEDIGLLEERRKERGLVSFRDLLSSKLTELGAQVFVPASYLSGFMVPSLPVLDKDEEDNDEVTSELSVTSGVGDWAGIPLALLSKYIEFTDLYKELSAVNAKWPEATTRSEQEALQQESIDIQKRIQEIQKSNFEYAHALCAQALFPENRHVGDAAANAFRQMVLQYMTYATTSELTQIFVEMQREEANLDDEWGPFKAALIDQLRFRGRMPQRYGMLWLPMDSSGPLIVAPITLENPAEADSRRSEVGLPSLYSAAMTRDASGQVDSYLPAEYVLHKLGVVDAQLDSRS